MSPYRRTALLTSAAIIIVAAAAATMPAAEEPPLGHPDLLPSPERPIGWFGDGNGCFPGANLVDRFGDGPYKAEQVGKGKRKVTAHLIAEAKPTNIAWHVDLPAFTHAQPIVVGHRAIQPCEPHTLLCIDMHSGKQLWRRDLDVFVLLGLPEQEAVKARKLHDHAWVLHALAINVVGNYTRLPADFDQEDIDHWRERGQRLLAMAQEAAAIDQDLAGGSVAAAEKLLAMTTPDVLKPAEGKGKRKGPQLGIAKQFIEISEELRKALHQRYSVHAFSHWYSWVGNTWPTPVSDGRHIYGFMGQGQVYCLDLDGTVVWSAVLPMRKKIKQPIPRSPLLVDGVLVVPFYETYHGFDAATGEQLWSQGGYDLDVTGFTPKALTTPGGKSVLVGCSNDTSEDYLLIDPRSGTILDKLKRSNKKAHDPGPSIVGRGNIAFHPYSRTAMEVTDDGDTAKLKELFTIKGFSHGGAALPLCGDRIYAQDGIYSLTDGKKIAGKPDNGYLATASWKPTIVVGDRLLSRSDDIKPHHLVSWPRRFGGMGEVFVIADRDGRVISRDNILFYPKIPVPWAEELAPEAYAAGKLMDQNAGVPTVGYAAPFAAGNRVLIPTLGRLYCIGDPAVPFNGPKP